MYNSSMQFTWDERKRDSNLSRHGLDFADAEQVFAGAIALFEDSRHDYGEQRMIAIGLLSSLVVMVVHVETDDVIRVISMRKASKHEANLYYQNIGFS